MSPPDTVSRCVAQLPPGLCQDDEPVFAEPWQAQAFAMAVSLIESGRFSWGEWAQALGYEIAHAASHGIAEDGSGYYELWLRALEQLLARSALVSPAELDELQSRWRQAYRDTPHGQPVAIDDAGL